MSERENKNGHIKRDLIILASGTFLASFFAVLGVDRGGNCVGKAEFEGKHKLISACVNTDNKIVIHKDKFDPVTLPDGICRLAQVWSISDSDNKIIYFRYLDEGYSFELNQINAETGELGIPTKYFIPRGMFGFGHKPKKSEFCQE